VTAGAGVGPASPVRDGRPRLLEQMRSAIRARHYSRATERAYVRWVRRLVRFHGMRHPNELGPGEITSAPRTAAAAHVQRVRPTQF